jgi:hypothetical protein
MAASTDVDDPFARQAIAGIVLGWVGAGTFLYVLLLVGSLTAALP